MMTSSTSVQCRPSPMSTLRPPDIFHMTSVLGPSLLYHSSTSEHHTKHKQKNKKRGRPGMRLLTGLRNNPTSSSWASVRELVDSLCRDGTNTQYTQYLSKNHTTSPQICQKHICLSAQLFALSAFMISKTHISAQKATQKTAKCKCVVAKVTFFVFFPSFFLSLFRPQYSIQYSNFVKQ